MTEASSQPRGLFITLEGVDGGGKSTQIRRLRTWLENEGIEVVVCRDPGGTPLGEKIRELLLQRSSLAPSMTTEMLLYMSSRAQLVSEVVEPAITSGKVVVCDRFLLSNVVYQGVAGGLGAEKIWRVGAIATKGMTPDLTLLIDLPIELAAKRIGTARDRLEDRPDTFRQAVQRGYVEAAAGGSGIGPDYLASIRVIDGSLDEETVSATILLEVQNALARRPRP